MSDSESDEENVACYGTPLDPIEIDDVPSKRKFQEPPDQYAVDAHGRRRFHGAFTGGFSAGYGNTVGTPEGWTPTSFKSSRSEKAQSSSQRPEDFMDEEDRTEFGIAPRQIQTHSEFTGQKRKHQRYHDGPIPGEPVLEQLLKAVHETAAVRMLRAMGWKPGQGTGVRITKAEKKRIKEQHKVYGCYIPPEMKQNLNMESDDDSSDSEYDYETLFAPDDYEPYILQRKSDRFGLGYSGLSRHSVLGGLSGTYGEGAKSHLIMKDKGKKVSIRGQAFGVGAFEADDEDIYANEDMSHYDFELGSAPKDKKKAPANNLKEVNVPEGFVRASNPMPTVASYPPPSLPRGYVPAPAGARRSRFEPSSAPQRDQGLGRHELTAEARGALLGEEPIKALPESTPPKEPVKDDAIAQITGRNVNFVSTSKTSEPSELDFISIKDSGKEVPKTFRPFASTPAKQARYERYLEDRESYMVELEESTDAVSEWERNRELVEFEQAAKLYKPLTGIMGDRFTHASQPDDALNPLIAVARSSSDYGLATAEQVESAKLGVYGAMTRRTVPWRPDALVCKRFNIPQPGGDRIASKTEDKPKVSYSIFSYLETSVHDKESFTKEQSKFSGSKSLNLPKPTQDGSGTKSDDATNKVESQMPATIGIDEISGTKRMTVADLFIKESEEDSKSKEIATDTIQKFDKMELYKSIFLSDSENEDDVPNNTKPTDGTDNTDINDFVDKPTNVERNLSPPRGIFTNIDFDELNSWRRNDVKDKAPKPTDNIEKPATKIDENIEDVYGPKIPDNIKNKVETTNGVNPDFKPIFRSKKQMSDVHEIESSSSSDSWVDLKAVKSKKVKKVKKKKQKGKHKKSKHKKKDY